MRFNKITDPRQELCQTKFFGLRPQPLQSYLYRLRLSACAERVFWLHWDEGYREGSFCSEIPLRVVADRVYCKPCSVTRAYQALIRLGLLRRIVPGRDPSNPFRQATAVTEVCIPAHVLPELLNAPNRRPARMSDIALESSPDTGSTSNPTAEPDSTPLSEEWKTINAEIQRRYQQWGMREILARMSAAEKARYFEAQNRGDSSCTFEPDSRIDALEQRWIQLMLERLEIQAKQRQAPQIGAIRVQKDVRALQKSRQIHTFLLASLRKRLADIIKGPEIDVRMREIVWSVEEGALNAFNPEHAINIALKKLREGQWTSPRRMPSNWRRAVA